MRMRRDFAIAVLITLLDVAVVVRYCPPIWAAWGAMPWARFLLLLLAGIGCFTLMDIWARIVAPIVSRQPSEWSQESALPGLVAMDLERTDV